MRVSRSAIVLLLVLTACSTQPPPAEAPPPAIPRPPATAAQVLAYLASLPSRADHRLLSGQNIGHGAGAVEGYDRFVTALRTETGRAPAVVTVDYSAGSLDAAAIRDINRLLIAHWDRGGLVSVNLASLNSPFTGGNCKDRDGANLRELLTPGTRGFAAWREALDTIAAGLAELRDAGVVVLFRPLHEMNLTEFWWGRAPVADYVALWRAMHRYLTEDKRLDNLLWVYAPAANPWGGAHIAPVEEDYPGADVVDVVALDYYDNGFERLAAGGMEALLKLGKPFGISEYGPELNLSQYSAHDLREAVASFQAKAPKAAFFWHWHSWGISRMALVDQEHVGEALADPWVVNRDGVEILPCPAGK